MIKGTLASGFAFEIKKQNLDNMELVDAIAEADTNPIAVAKVVKLLLGDQQKKALYDHLRTENGNVPIAAVSNAIAEIFRNSNQQVKN